MAYWVMGLILKLLIGPFRVQGLGFGDSGCRLRVQSSGHKRLNLPETLQRAGGGTRPKP